MYFSKKRVLKINKSYIFKVYVWVTFRYISFTGECRLEEDHKDTLSALMRG